MSNDTQRPMGTVTLPGEVSTNREVIRLIREKNLVVHFDCAGFEAYVKAPDGIVHEFPVWYNDHYSHDPDEKWQQTSIDPLTLKRELSDREFSIETESTEHRRLFRTPDK